MLSCDQRCCSVCTLPDCANMQADCPHRVGCRFPPEAVQVSCPGHLLRSATASMKAVALFCLLAGVALAQDPFVRLALQKKPLTAAQLDQTSQLAGRHAANGHLLGASPEADIPLRDYLDAQVLVARPIRLAAIPAARTQE